MYVCATNIHKYLGMSACVYAQKHIYIYIYIHLYVYIHMPLSASRRLVLALVASGAAVAALTASTLGAGRMAGLWNLRARNLS